MKKITVIMMAAILFLVSAAGVNAGTGIQTVLVPEDNVGIEFGRDVAINNQTVLVGESSGGTGYIYEFEKDVWVQKAALSMNESSYTHNVALSDNFAILASDDSLHIFEKPVSGWADTNEVTVLIPNDFNPENNRISDVNIHGNTVVVGTGVGSLDIGKRQFYIFEFDGKEWIQTATVSGDAFPKTGFGLHVDVYGDRIIASGLSASTTNTFYIFKKDGGGAWYLEAELNTESSFSIKNVAITDGYAIAGGSGDIVYIFRYDNEHWFLSQKISEKDETGKYGYFGWGVDINPEYAVIGFPLYSAKDIPVCGAVFLLKNQDGIYVKTEVYTPENPQLVGFFGYSLSISDDYFVAGHINDHLNSRNGSAIVFSLFAPGDLDRDGCVGKNDAAILRTYLNRPVSECPECNLDGKDDKITILDARTLVKLCTNANCECP